MRTIIAKAGDEIRLLSDRPSDPPLAVVVNTQSNRVVLVLRDDLNDLAIAMHRQAREQRRFGTAARKSKRRIERRHAKRYA